MQAEKIPQQTEERSTRKAPKTFSIKTSILLLLLSIVVSTGTGYALGKFYFWNDVDLKRVNEQLEYYQEQVKKDPKNLENRVILGYTYFLKGQNEKAIREFDTVLEHDKNYYDAHYNMGLVFLDKKKYNDALLAFSKAVKIAPKDYKGHVQMGITYRNLKMYEEAEKSLFEANLLNPANADIIYNIGLVAEERGDFETADEIYKDALEFDPLYEDAINALERIKDKVKDTKTEGEKK